MPVLKVLGGLRRFGVEERRVSGATVGAVLHESSVAAVLFPDGQLHRDVEVLVNGRNIAFLAGLDTPLTADDRVTLFVNGVRGYPGG